MKKIIFCAMMIAILAAGTTFADYPRGMGIGVQSGGGGTWDGGRGTFGDNATLSLKLPDMPYFWSIRLDFNDHYFGLGVAGDHYLIHDAIVRDIGLHWYIGVGVGVGISVADDYLGLGLAARLPIGLSWQPIPILEVFLQIVPQLGVSIMPDFHFPYGGWGGDLGIRIWL